MSPYFLLSLSCFFWSLNFIIAKLIVDVVPPLTISLFRWGLPLLFYLGYSWRHIRIDMPIYKRHWALLLLLGATGYSLNGIAVYEAVFYTSTINTSFINAFNPVLIAITGFALFRYPTSGGQVLGFLVSLIGVAWIIFRGDIASIIQLDVNVGDVIMVGSITFWAIHTILYKRYATQFPANSLFTMMMLGGTLVTLPLAIAENVLFGFEWLGRATLQHFAGMICLSVFPSVLAYRFWNQSLRLVDANKVAAFQYLIPVYTVLISVLFLGESLRPFQMIGGGLIFIGVLLVTCRKTELAKV